MRFLHLTFCIVFSVVIVSCSPTKEIPQQQQTNGPSSEKVTTHIADLPASDQTENEWIFSELVDLGPSGIHSLANMLVAPGSGDDTQVRYAVNGITKYVSRPGAESERAMVENVLIDELRSNHHQLVKVFLMEQLELIGSNESVPVLQSFIGDDRLNESAVHALRAINTTRARETLAEALSGTQGEQRIAVIKALGDIETTDITQDLLPLASAEESDTRKVALYALAQSGDPEAEEALASAVDAREGYEQTEAKRYYLLYAGRLAEEGHNELSADISRDILSGSFTSDARSSALSILVEQEGEAALDDLIDAAESSDARLRSTALKLFEQHADWQVPERWITATALDELAPAVQADIIAMLGRSERGSVSTLSSFLDSDELPVRIAAAQATAAAGGEEARPVLFEALTEAQQPEDIAALKNALLQLPARPVVSEAADLLPSASEPVKVALIEMLAERRADRHLNTVLNQLNTSSDPVRMAVLQSLGDIAEPDDLPQLVDLLAEAQNENERRAVQESVVRVSGAKPEALKVIAAHFDDDNEDIREGALRSAARILSAADEGSKQELALIEATTNPENKKKIEQYIQELKTVSDETGNFTSLFNGEDLTGWVGDKDSYTVSDGQIISKDGASGNLFTENEYSNFNLRFDFKLTPGANNGLAIRAPLDSHPAYDAMELQILDNTAEKYEELEPYQFHGSIYGVAPAERGYLNPVGEWNTQEVIADGSQITVKVNGQTITDVDLADIDTSDTMDGRDHPGLLRETGHIGFLGHGDEVAFRNIRIQDLGVYYPDYSSESGNGDGMNQPPEGREISRKESLFNGEDLSGWERASDDAGEWHVEDGLLYTEGGSGWLSTTETYDNFKLELEYRLPEGGNSGVFLRAPREGNPAYEGLEIQLLDDEAEPYAELEPWQYTGSIYDVKAPSKKAGKKAGEWQKMEIIADGSEFKVKLNGETINKTDLVYHMDRVNEHPGLKRRSGYIGLQNHNSRVEFRNITITEIK